MIGIEARTKIRLFGVIRREALKGTPARTRQRHDSDKLPGSSLLRLLQAVASPEVDGRITPDTPQKRIAAGLCPTAILIHCEASERRCREVFCAEREGFEPPVPCGTTDFETATFDHSAISPKYIVGRKPIAHLTNARQRYTFSLSQRNTRQGESAINTKYPWLYQVATEPSLSNSLRP